MKKSIGILLWRWQPCLSSVRCRRAVAADLPVVKMIATADDRDEMTP